MLHTNRLGIVLLVLGLAIVAIVAWPRTPAAIGAPVAGGDPNLADLSLIPSDVRGNGKYSFFILERENSSQRWFMRFNSETGDLEKLTPSSGWAAVGSTSGLGR